EFYFAVVTMGFSEVLRLITLNWNSVTNGSLGITVMAKPTIWTPSGSFAVSSGVAWYYLTLVLLVFVYFICQRVLSSWIGRCLAAIRLNDQLGETLGIDVFKYKLLSFTVGSALAGLVGAFYGFYSGFVEPHYLSITLGLDIVAMVLLGGVNSLIGPVIGALVLTALPHVIELGAELRIALYGSILIFVILVMPKGIVGLITSRKNAA
ncbi:MAG: branched-chain amino acid ABC transporter permease, partial [Afipia sp.]|nr:branched-chain amino acid ABC transporter permease [Afipia sp.]